VSGDVTSSEGSPRSTSKLRRASSGDVEAGIGGRTPLGAAEELLDDGVSVANRGASVYSELDEPRPIAGDAPSRERRDGNLEHFGRRGGGEYPVVLSGGDS
jgi:hypothetical protein